MRCFVLSEPTQDVLVLHVGLGAQRDSCAETEALPCGVADDARDQRTGLTERAHVAGGGRRLREARVQTHGRPQGAEAVGPDQADAVCSGAGQHLVLEGPTLLAHLGKPGRDDDRVSDADGPRLVHQGRNEPRRNRDQHQVGAGADLGQTRVHPLAQDRPALEVDGIHEPREAQLAIRRSTDLTVKEVAEERVADLRLVGAGAHDGHGAGLEERVEVVRHGRSGRGERRLPAAKVGGAGRNRHRSMSSAEAGRSAEQEESRQQAVRPASVTDLHRISIQPLSPLGGGRTGRAKCHRP